MAKKKEYLVPDSEQLYNIPSNWEWIYLVGFAECLDGFRKPINAKERALKKGNIPYYGATGQVGWIDDYLTDEQLVLLGEDGAPFLDTLREKAYLIEGKAWVNNHAHVLRSFYGEAGNHFLVNYLNFFDYTGYVNGSTRLKLTQANMNRIPIPLPPLAEQRRIVERIESLFARLDEVRERVQAALDGLELYKAKVLYEAFHGDLTAKWRENHGVSLASWKSATLNDIGEIITGSTPDTKNRNYYGGTVPFIKPTELNQGRHISTSIDTLTESGKSVSRPIRAGATCICCIGATIGKCGFLDVDAVTNQQINSIVPFDFMDDIYVYYYCCSGSFRNLLISNSSATTLPIINKRKTSLLPIDVPSFEEQREIARILDMIFSQARQAQSAAETALKQVELMKKIILARAFRGELGTNRPEERVWEAES